MYNNIMSLKHIKTYLKKLKQKSGFHKITCKEGFSNVDTLGAGVIRQ